MGSQVAIRVPDKKLDRFVLDKILRGESITIYFFYPGPVLPPRADGSRKLTEYQIGVA